MIYWLITIAQIKDRSPLQKKVRSISLAKSRNPRATGINSCAIKRATRHQIYQPKIFQANSQK